MTSLMAAAVVFLLLHLLISGTSVRDTLTRAVGEGPYMILFSLASVACLAWIILAFPGARSAERNAVFWKMTIATRDIQVLIQFIAFQFIVIGLITPNPTSVRQLGVLDRPDAVKGILRITRHPFLWGVALWATGHITVNGNLAALILFGTMLVLAVVGPFSIDAKRKAALGDRWAPFAAQTSNIPFAAILMRRQKLNLTEIGWWRIVLAEVIWMGVNVVHPFLFGGPGAR